MGSRKKLTAAWFVILFLLASVFLLGQSATQNAPASSSNQQPVPVKADAEGYVGNQACARCHAAIYDAYTKTPMAHASGPATENVITGDFADKTSGVNYRVYEEGGNLWLSFDRPGDPSVHGKRELLYYIGQGRRGRTYLFSVDGFVFEAPINWYADRHLWDMAPAYGNAREIPMNLPALPSCMACHVSGVQPPIAGTENRYKMPVFGFSGVTCERCHGPGAAHVNSGGAIVNPARLSPARRDAVCMQCHLEGDVAVQRPGKHIYDYRPGNDLSDYIRYYLVQDSSKPGLRAASQFEALSQSMCKRKSGDSMTCTSCHDPHTSVAPQERVAYYRAKCIACHGDAFAQKHHATQPDCTSCHMPASLSTDVAHTEVTDHRIERRPSVGPALQTDQPITAPRLVSFPAYVQAQDDPRDTALAWQTLSQKGIESAKPIAEKQVHAAVIDFPKDAALLAAMGYIDQQKGKVDDAREFYQRALAVDPTLVDVASNLGILEARSGHLREAVKLWEGAFKLAPWQSSIGINLARAFCVNGQVDPARDFTLRVLQFNPDMATAKSLLNDLNASPPRCGQ